MADFSQIASDYLDENPDLETFLINLDIIKDNDKEFSDMIIRYFLNPNRMSQLDEGVSEEDAQEIANKHINTVFVHYGIDFKIDDTKDLGDFFYFLSKEEITAEEKCDLFAELVSQALDVELEKVSNPEYSHLNDLIQNSSLILIDFEDIPKGPSQKSNNPLTLAVDLLSAFPNLEESMDCVKTQADEDNAVTALKWMIDEDMFTPKKDNYVAFKDSYTHLGRIGVNGDDLEQVFNLIENGKAQEFIMQMGLGAKLTEIETEKVGANAYPQAMAEIVNQTNARGFEKE